MVLPASVAGAPKLKVMPGGKVASEAVTLCSAMGLRFCTISVPVTVWPGISEALMPLVACMPIKSKLSCGVLSVRPGYTAAMV